MRIIVFGNTNNYPLLLAKGIRAIGHDAVLLVNRKEILNRPEGADKEIAAGYPSWIIDISDIPEEDYIAASYRIGPVINILAEADALILNNIGPSLLGFVNKPAIAFLTGSDLDYYANYASMSARMQGWSEELMRTPAAILHTRLWIEFVRRQRAGILAAQGLSYFPHEVIPAGDAILNDIGVSDSRRFFIYIANLFDLTMVELPKRDRVRIFCGTRLTWQKPMRAGSTSLDYKGSDLMIKGLGLFLKQYPDAPVEVRIVRKGWDVAETLKLSEEEGILSHVVWLNEMSLTDFFDELREADIVFEQLDQSFVGMAGHDAMSMGKPVIANGRQEIFERFLKRSLPVCQATTPEQVYQHLEKLVFDDGERKKMGMQARSYVEQYMSPQYYAQKCIDMLSGSVERQSGTINISMADVARAMAVHKRLHGDNITPETLLKFNLP